LHKSHLSVPSRFGKIDAGRLSGLSLDCVHRTLSFGQELHKVVHRTDRCDLSLFQLGLRVLDYLLDFNLPISGLVH